MVKYGFKNKIVTFLNTPCIFLAHITRFPLQGSVKRNKGMSENSLTPEDLEI